MQYMSNETEPYQYIIIHWLSICKAFIGLATIASAWHEMLIETANVCV